MTVVQLTDTHVSPAGPGRAPGRTARYLADAVTAVNALGPDVDYVVVTGDLVNVGDVAEYEAFRDVMTALRAPYFVIPGNHDRRDVMREVLPPETFGFSWTPAVRYAIDEFPIRLIGLDGNRRRPAAGAKLDAATLAWLDETLAREPSRPTLVAVHQPPFRTGLHYLDAFGFVGARELRAVVDRYPGVGRVLCGHIHCRRSQRWRHALATSAPSTAPQAVPLLFMDGRVLGVRSETAGFAVHRWEAGTGFATTFLRRDAAGAYRPEP